MPPTQINFRVSNLENTFVGQQIEFSPVAHVRASDIISLIDLQNLIKAADIKFRISGINEWITISVDSREVRSARSLLEAHRNSTPLVVILGNEPFIETLRSADAEYESHFSHLLVAKSYVDFIGSLSEVEPQILRKTLSRWAVRSKIRLGYVIDSVDYLVRPYASWGGKASTGLDLVVHTLQGDDLSTTQSFYFLALDSGSLVLPVPLVYGRRVKKLGTLNNLFGEELLELGSGE